MSTPTKKIAIVGCGSVSELFHAPAIQAHGGYTDCIMVDTNPDRAAVLQKLIPGSSIETDYAQLRGRVDGAIIALPSHLNGIVAADILDIGINVLIEQPAALNSTIAKKLIDAEKRSQATLAVGFIRREAVSIRLARFMIQKGMLGEIKSFSIEDGYPFNWNSIDKFRFDNERGGGIMMDIGSHVLDTLSYWFGGLKITSYYDDYQGGIDANTFIDIQTDSGIKGTAEISWTRTLRNTAIIEGTLGTLEIGWYINQSKLTINDETFNLAGNVKGKVDLSSGAENFRMMFLSQLKRWDQLLSGNETGMARGHDALNNIMAIEQCFQQRQNLPMQWRSSPEVS